jgi:RNA polymerase sigma-70 factor (ECF subfamily)
MKPLDTINDLLPHAEASDGSLLRRFQAGSEQAAADLYRRYARRIHRLAESSCRGELGRRLDADDVVQSVFSSFFRRARDGDYEVPDGHELWGLLLVMALNKIRARGAFHRAARRDVRATQPADSLEDTVADDRHDELALATLRLAVDEALQSHPESNRQIVRLRIEGFEVAEIAARSGRSRRTVERVLQEFRHQLREALAPEADR